jgi:hypothetical protein
MKARLWTSGSVVLLFALSGGAVQAQDRGRDQDHHDQGRRDQNQSTQYRDDRHGQVMSDLPVVVIKPRMIPGTTNIETIHR